MTDQFKALGVGKSLLRALHGLGFATPTPIQQQAIPHVLEGRDAVALAQTGTGKTAAFGLPMLQRLQTSARKRTAGRPQALVLAPTRELASQIGEDLETFARYTTLKSAVIFGGVNQKPQVRTLRDGVDILIATPGRLLDLAEQGFLDLGEVDVLVLDEADRLLDMGFIRDIRKIVAQTPSSRQSLLFSATMPREVTRLADEILSDPVRVEVARTGTTVDRIEQRVLHVAKADKQEALVQLLRQQTLSRAIVFTRTKHHANRVAKKLEKAGVCAAAIHGNKSQGARERALNAFRGGDIWVLVATDIAARGIDIADVSHVINVELPHEPEAYVHRIGRTGRAGADGTAWSLVDQEEAPRLAAIHKLIGFDLIESRLEDGELIDLEAAPDTAASAPDNRDNRSQRPRRRRRRRRSKARSTQIAAG